MFAVTILSLSAAIFNLSSLLSFGSRPLDSQVSVTKDSAIVMGNEPTFDLANMSYDLANMSYDLANMCPVQEPEKVEKDLHNSKDSDDYSEDKNGSAAGDEGNQQDSQENDNQAGDDGEQAENDEELVHNTSRQHSVNRNTQPVNTRYGFPVLPFVELDDNQVTLRGEINSMMVSKAMIEMGKLEDDEIIIYISSPGGSISAGNSFIQYMNFLRSRGKTLTCVADIAASMAFSIFQECDNRYVTPSSVLMQHQMAVGLKDQYENLKSYLKLLEAMNEDYLHRESARIGLTYDEFKSKILSDWWLFGEQNVQSNVADKVVYVGCSQELLEGEMVEKYKFRGESFDVVFSKCPLSRAPLRVVPSKDKKKRGEREDREDRQYGLENELMIEIIKSMMITLEKKDVKCST